MRDLQDIIEQYDPSRPLERACTPPAAWYTDLRVAELERRGVFGRSWQFVGRAEQLSKPGQYVTADVAGEPIVVVRGGDERLRAFFNVCRHHAAEVMTEPCGEARVLQCPYHGWTYSLEGELRGMSEFDGVCDFAKADNGLVPVRVGTWEGFVFVCLDAEQVALSEFLGGMAGRVRPLSLASLRFCERRVYEIDCNWKVFVDNYLDGGYHVPHIHHGLGSVLSFQDYKIETLDRYCLQSSPITADKGEAETAAVRTGDAAYYFWLYPNFMLNWYEGVMDTNIAFPLGPDRCRVIFDFFFDDVGDTAEARNRRSIAVGERVQDEDIAVCESVQRGVRSRAYDVGRLSVRREAGEHLFHRLLYADLAGALGHDE